MSHLVERSCTLVKAQALWNEVVKKHQLKSSRDNYTVNGFTVQICYLNYKNNSYRGMGKGQNCSQIKLSASYEVIEFALSAYEFNSYPIVNGSIATISKQYFTLPYRSNSKIFLNASNQKIDLPWVLYEDYRTQEAYVVPLAEVDLKYINSPMENDKFDYMAA